MLKTFNECQWKFFLKYVQKLSLPQRSKIFETGKKIHALASYYLKGENIEKLEKALTEDEKQVWATLKSSKYFSMQPVETEYNLSCKIGEWWVGGRLDALVVNTLASGPSFLNEEEGPYGFCHPSSQFIILDYKTGQIPQNAESDFQTIVYLLCSDRFLNLKGGYESLKFVYIGLKNDSEREIFLTSDNKKNYEEKLMKILKDIEFALKTKVFEKNSDKCKFCEYCKLCKQS